MIATTPALEYREEQQCVSIPISVPMKEWGKANALLPEVLDWMGKNGIAPAGPLFYRYHVIGDMDEPFDLEIGFPIAQVVKGDERVSAGVTPAGTYATLVHQGHPDGLYDTCTVLEAWAAREDVTLDIRNEGDREIWGGRFEFYLSNPAEQPDPATWRTEVAYLTWPAQDGVSSAGDE